MVPFMRQKYGGLILGKRGGCVSKSVGGHVLMLNFPRFGEGNSPLKFSRHF